MTPEDLVAVVDVLAGLLPEFSGARIVRPGHWPRRRQRQTDPSPASTSTQTRIQGRAMDERARAMAETIRRLKPSIAATTHSPWWR